jgi:hypothetical protein
MTLTLNKKFLFILLLGGLLAKTAWADNPFLTDNPETLAHGQKYIVLYGAYNQYEFGKVLLAPALEFDFNVFPNFEIDTYTPITSVFESSGLGPGSPLIGGDSAATPNATGLGDIDIELKYRFLQESTYLPQVAFAPNIYLPTGDFDRGLGNGRLWYYPALTAQKTFGTWLVYGTSGYVIINGTPGLRNYFFEGVVAQKTVNDKFTIGAELYNQGSSAEFVSPLTLLNLGMQYNITKNCTLYGSMGHSVLGENLWIAYTGIGWG